MKHLKSIGIILFILTLISPIVSFALMCWIGEVDALDIPGMIHYSWIMWLFIPIGIGSIVVGVRLMQQRQKYVKNFVVAIISIFLLVIFGSYRFIFSDIVSYDPNVLVPTETTLSFDFPDQARTGTLMDESRYITYIKIATPQAIKDFESEIARSEKWTKQLPTPFQKTLFFDCGIAPSFDSFLLYNVSTGEYNRYPTKDGQYECIIASYDKVRTRIIVVHRYILTVEGIV